MTATRNIALSVPCVGEADWQAMLAPIESGWVAQGPMVAAFEKAFAQRHAVDHAAAATSCTAGLHLVLMAMGIGPGDEVIVPAFTWIATANAVCYCGAKPVFVDVQRDTYNLDPALLAACVTSRTRAILAVHLFGLCADIDAIRAATPGVPIIEDAACAAGSAYRNKPAGSLTEVAAFSFHPRKTITTGEGGMVTSNNGELIERIRRLRNHGASVAADKRHGSAQPQDLGVFAELGYNYRMTDLQAAMGISQLQRLDQFITQRRQWADIYAQTLAEVRWLKLPHVPSACNHSWQSFVCYVDAERAPMSRDEIMQQLLKQGIATRPGTMSVPHQAYYRTHLGVTDEQFSISADLQRQTLAIPMHNRMSEDDVRYVARCLQNIA